MVNMDGAWKSVYDSRARRNIEDYKRSCWTKEGFEELVSLTMQFVDEINSSDNISTILDVGCGPGNYCDLLFKKGFRVIGVDYSEEMIKVAKEKYPSITFEVGSGYDLKFENKSFDMVLSIGTLQCLLDHEKFLSELARVSSKYIIISTLWRDDDGVDPKIILERQLREDSWPTREYHPSEIIPILESYDFSCKIIRENDGMEIKDGYFIIAKKN